jgi:hypothetical protein
MLFAIYRFCGIWKKHREYLTMATVQSRGVTRNDTSHQGETETEVRYEKWHHWHVNWTAVWIGTLASIAAALIFGLIGIAVGAHLLGPANRVVDLHKFGIGALIFSVLGAFFAFVMGGWTTGKIAGILHSEPAMLHGAVCWLLGIPLLTALMATGAGSFFGGWFGGLSGTPAWAAPASAPFERPEPLGPTATTEDVARYRASLDEYHREVKQWNEDTPKAARNSALGAVTALLIGLVGSVIGGWMACGEPMNLTHYKTRKTVWSPSHSS